MNPGEPRDRALEALLSSRARPGPATAQCLDAETLAAYAEGGLDTRSRAEAEAHMAGCAHCQTVMAAIVTSAGEVAPAPAREAGRAWWRPDLRWLMPLAGAAAAVVLWMVVPTGGPAPQRANFQDAVSPAAIEPGTAAPPPTREPAPSAGPRPGDGRAIVPASPQVAEKKVAPEPARDLAAPQTDQSTRERVEADNAPRANEEPRRAEPDLLAKAEDRRTAVTGATSAPPPAAAPEARAAETDRLAAPPPPPPVAAAPPAARALSLADRSAPSDAPELRSLDPAVRWRLAEPGFVERSTNGGASWDRLDTGVRTPLRAGACPSASTCWIVGDAGVVLLTTDARTWQRLALPPTEDLVAVEAPDARTAVVRSAGGRAFRTNDGGVMWRPEP